MIFPFNKEVYWIVRYGDLGEMIKEVYDLEKRVEFDGMNNDCIYEYKVANPQSPDYDKDMLAKEMIGIFEYLKKHGCIYYLSLTEVLEDMCLKGLIQPGKYLMKVSW